jgi:hypothetical protein
VFYFSFRQECRLCSRFVVVLACFVLISGVYAASTQKRYYAHDAVEDKFGVIAPWYRGLNGQYDLRVRIAAETLKGYPWTTTTHAIAVYPHYVFTGHWRIATNGTITRMNTLNWNNGDLGQRATRVLSGFVG